MCRVTCDKEEERHEAAREKRGVRAHQEREVGCSDRPLRRGEWGFQNRGRVGQFVRMDTEGTVA